MTGTEPRILFLAAHGRSGTTLLGQMLGEIQGFVFVGEVINAFGLPPRHLCGCGRDVDDCPFWRAVLRGDRTSEAAREAARVRRVLGRHTAGILAPRLRSKRFRASLETYASAFASLYRGVHRATDGAVILDSSKEPLHATIMSRVAGLDVRMLHVVRDARGAAFSWQRAKRKPDVPEEELYMPRFHPARSGVAWLGRNAVIEAVSRSLASARVRYEDVMRNGAAALRPALTAVGADPGPLSGGLVVRIGRHHTISGNPGRFDSGEIELRVDEEWVTAMPVRTRALVTAITWPLLLRYGYPLVA